MKNTKKKYKIFLNNNKIIKHNKFYNEKPIKMKIKLKKIKSLIKMKKIKKIFLFEIIKAFFCRQNNINQMMLQIMNY